MKSHLTEFLSGDDAPDVLVWSAGTNVEPYKKYLALIDQTPAWFDEAMDYVGSRVKENFHFVPFKTYVWAFYYLKNTWPESWNEPKTFDALVASAKLMRKSGLEPIAFGNVHGWPALGYLDAINMRVAGFTCHQKLMERTADWAPLGVKRDGCKGISATLSEWQRLVPYFSEGWYSTSYRDAARQLATHKAGMFFIGGFFAEELSTDLLSQLRVFEFPYTSKDFRGVDAPIDGFVFPMKAKQRRPTRCDKPMREFIEFLRSKEAYRAYDAKNPGSSLSVLKGMNYTLEVQKAALGILELNDKDHRVEGFFDREFKVDAPNPALPQDPVGEVVIPELHAFLISSASKEISSNSILLGVQKKLPPVP